MSRWRWICINCGFIHISDCPREHIDEVLEVGALCPIPTCRAKLRAPIEESETEKAVVDYYAG
jgi:hypothetical protein